MKKYVLSLFIIFLSSQLLAQNLENFNQKRININKVGMLTLGSWAVGNILVGSIMRSNASGGTQYFWDGNIYWNLVNLGLAGFAYYNLSQSDPAGFNLFESINEQYNIQKILLLNSGLDVAYMAGGFFLKERSKNINKRKTMFEGFGNALILQGAFLLAFDITLYFIHANRNSFFENLLLSQDGIGILYKF